MCVTINPFSRVRCESTERIPVSYAAAKALYMASGRRKKSKEEEKPAVRLEGAEQGKAVKRRRSRDEGKQFRDEKRPRVSSLWIWLLWCRHCVHVHVGISTQFACRFLIRPRDKSDGTSSVPESQLQQELQLSWSLIGPLPLLEEMTRYTRRSSSHSQAFVHASCICLKHPKLNIHRWCWAYRMATSYTSLGTILHQDVSVYGVQLLSASLQDMIFAVYDFHISSCTSRVRELILSMCFVLRRQNPQQNGRR